MSTTEADTLTPEEAETLRKRADDAADAIEFQTEVQNRCLRIRKLRAEYAGKKLDFDAAKNCAKESKKALDDANEELNEFIEGWNNDAKRPLFADKKAAPDAWRALSIGELGLPEGLTAKLVEADPPLDTLGKLADFQEVGITWYQKVKGVGEAANGKVETAWAEFWAKHPEFCVSPATLGQPRRVRLREDRENVGKAGDEFDVVETAELEEGTRLWMVGIRPNDAAELYHLVPSEYEVVA
ncbi:MAG: hypothetical protein JW809_19470 [Pirellulales bacterium]|nr:hypothetical protein [Pirellulales bacterium]